MPKSDDQGRLTRLIDTRDRLAAAIAEGPSPRDLAGLSREYRQVLAELDSLQPHQEASHVDEITKRRAARAAGAAAKGGAKRPG